MGGGAEDAVGAEEENWRDMPVGIGGAAEENWRDMPVGIGGVGAATEVVAVSGRRALAK